MKRNKRGALPRARGSARPLIIIAAGCLLIACTIGGALAWLTSGAALNNDFGVKEVTLAVTEGEFSQGESLEKTDVAVRNTGTMDAYIRVALIPAVKIGQSVLASDVTLEDFIIDWGDMSGGWFAGEDGYYYCRLPVAPNDSTPMLMTRCVAPEPPEGGQLELQILASGIQAMPKEAVESSWGVTVNDDGTISR